MKITPRSSAGIVPPIIFLPVACSLLFGGCMSASLERSVAVGGAGPSDAESVEVTATTATVTPGEALDEPTRDFLRDAILARRFAIAAMRIATERGASEDVRNFAQHGIGQQELILNRVETLAENLGVTVPPGLRDKGIELTAKLEGLSGAAFDDQFLDLMIKERERAVLAHQFAAEQANAEVRTFGVQFRDTFRAQVEELKALRERIRERGP